jgi:hypothetical protein
MTKSSINLLDVTKNLISHCSPAAKKELEALTKLMGTGTYSTLYVFGKFAVTFEEALDANVMWDKIVLVHTRPKLGLALLPSGVLTTVK